MHQRGGLQGLSRRFVGHLVRGQSAKFSVNERQEPLGGVFALLNGLKNLSDVAHGSRFFRDQPFYLRLFATSSARSQTGPERRTGTSNNRARTWNDREGARLLHSWRLPKDPVYCHQVRAPVEALKLHQAASAACGRIFFGNGS